MECAILKVTSNEIIISILRNFLLNADHVIVVTLSWDKCYFGVFFPSNIARFHDNHKKTYGLILWKDFTGKLTIM